MTNDLITKLNIQISLIDPKTLEARRLNGDLEEWIQEWRTETAAICFGLFTVINVLERKVDESKNKIW